MSKPEYPSDKLDQYMVRFPDGMRERLKASAKEQGRSLNAEIIAKLARYDSLGGEVDAAETVARALADAIDEVVGEDPDLLYDRIGDVFALVDEDGNFDKARVSREWTAEALRRLQAAMAGTFHLSDALVERIRAVAEREGRSVEAQVLSTLEREYPAPSDVMHVHLKNIRHALDLYERETDPQRRLQLQILVEQLAGSGHNIEIDWGDEGFEE